MTKRLVYIEGGAIARHGDVIRTFRGEEAILEGWTLPLTPASTGRVSLRIGGASHLYYPSVINAEFRAIPDPGLLDMPIVFKNETNLWLRLPEALQRPIDGGCECAFCRAHPALVPSWDTLNVPLALAPARDAVTFTIHAPEYPQAGGAR